MATSTLSRLESGARRLALDHLTPLAGALGVEVGDLLAPATVDPRVRARSRIVDGIVIRQLSRQAPGGLVVAHMGMPEYDEFLDLAERHDQLRLDTTMAFTDFTEGLMPFPRRALPRLADLGDRILLGSDFPNIPYPYQHQLQALERLGCGPDWLGAVCHDNAAALFGL